MNERPPISVVIATFNQAAYLGETLESVLRQSYPEVEIIVVDDGSTDATPAVAERYGGRIRYVRQENAERGAARNAGLRLAHGAFVAFLDSDDVWLPHKLEREAAVLIAQPDVAVVYSDVELIDAAGRRLGASPRPSFHGHIAAQLIRWNFLMLSATLARAEAVRAAGGFSEDRRLAAVLRHDAPRALDWRYLRTALRLLVPRPLLTLLGSLRRG